MIVRAYVCRQAGSRGVTSRGRSCEAASDPEVGFAFKARPVSPRVSFAFKGISTISVHAARVLLSDTRDRIQM